LIPSDPPVLAPGFHAVPPGHLAAVVTALEMTERPSGPSPPFPPGVRLERVVAPELGWYRALFRAVGADWLWTSRLAWDEAKLAATLGDEKVEIYALHRGAAEVGLLELDFRTPAECEIAFFGVVAGETGRGLGRAMMGAALARAWQPPEIRRVWVHTCTLDDPRAPGFYLAQGFRAYARQVEVLPDPRLSGLLPRGAAPSWPPVEP
jgi:GNAT superfamily N-acetyltransferase